MSVKQNAQDGAERSVAEASLEVASPEARSGTWRPVPYAAVLRRRGRKDATAATFAVGWLVFTLVCVASSILMVVLDWTGMPIQLGPVRLYLTVYPPLVLCTWALLWFGFWWAMIPAYLATLVGALVGGMPMGWALLFGLADPLGLAVFALVYRTAPLRIDLRTGASVFWFLVVAIAAALAGSSGSFLWSHTRGLGPESALAVWEGWWIGGFLQAVLLNAPVLALLTPAVEDWKSRRLGRLPRPFTSTSWTVGAVLASCATFALFVWASGNLARVNVAAALKVETPAEVSHQLAAAMQSLDLVVGHNLVMVVVGAIGALLLAVSWNRGLQFEVDERTRELAESEQRYALAAQGANDGLWDWDLRSNRVFYSPRWGSMLGLRQEELGYRIEDWTGRVHTDDRDQLRAALEAHVAGFTSHFEGEYRVQHRDGSYRWMLTRGLCVRGDDERPLRMAGSQTDITERRNAEEQLLHDALHDQLTGLPNRALFLDRLGGALARAERNPEYLFAVLFFDLDRFKVVNDSLGHEVGDRLLIAIAGRLESCLRSVDTVARLGGDEFAILLDDISRMDDATELATRIHTELARPFDIDGNEVFTSASIGIASSRTGYNRPEDVLRDADTAMYRAKHLGKARHQVFDTGMHARAVKLLLLETDLRRAVDRMDFTLHYQPIVRLETGRVVGFEALLRWIHPERGRVPHHEFLPLAEETGLIVPIGWWVLDQACRQIAQWCGGLDDDSPMSVSVNLSGRQLGKHELVTQVDSALAAAGIAPRRLRLEITESAVMENREVAAAILGEVQEMGVSIDVDDFGTGYSSLSYLHSLPLDRVKIDRSFVGSMLASAESMEIVRAIAGLATSLGLESVAEGVETEEQARALRAIACPFAQGFHFCGPVPPDEAFMELDRRSRS